MKTWKRGSCLIPTSCGDSLASKGSVPVTYPSLNPCRALCNSTLRFKWKFTTTAHTFHDTSKIRIYQFYPFPFGIRIIINHAISAGRVPSLNAIWNSITKSSHSLLTGSLLHAASSSHPFRSSARITGGPPDIPHFIPQTATAISASVVMPYPISACCTRMVSDIIFPPLVTKLHDAIRKRIVSFVKILL